MAASFPIRAVLLAIFGALLGAILWILIAVAADLERALPAVLVGVFAGAATRIEPHRGRYAQLAALAVTLIALAVAQYFVVRHVVVTELVETGGNRSIPMFLSPGSMWFVTFGWLRVFPIDAAFWLLSAGAAVFLPSGGEPTVTPLGTALASES